MTEASISGTTTPDFSPCRYCEGGYIEDVDDYSADWIECKFCDGTGDRYGRGPTLPNPHEAGR